MIVDHIIQNRIIHAIAEHEASTGGGMFVSDLFDHDLLREFDPNIVFAMLVVLIHKGSIEFSLERTGGIVDLNSLYVTATIPMYVATDQGDFE